MECLILICILQNEAKLASSILTTINGNITSAARDRSIIANYKNAVSFLFKDDDYPPLPFSALSNHHSVSNNVGNPAPNIIKPVHTKKIDFHRRPSTSNVSNNVVCVRKVMSVIIVALWHLITSTSTYNMFVFRLVVDRDSSFHNLVNGVKSSKTVPDLSVRENITTDFCSNITGEPIKSVLPRKSAYKSVSSKRPSRPSVSTSS